jgi:hypothetical protein
MIIKELGAGELQGLSSEICYIFGKVRIIKKGKFLADNGEELFADLPFFANGESLGRRRRKPRRGRIAEQKDRADDEGSDPPEEFMMMHAR